MLKDIGPGPASSNPGRIKVVENFAFFEATDPDHGYELWVTDGTAAGTFLVGDLNPGTLSSNANPLGSINGTLFFAGYVSPYSYELYSLAVDKCTSESRET